MLEAHRVNEYVLTGRGDPKTVLAGTARPDVQRERRPGGQA